MKTESKKTKKEDVVVQLEKQVMAVMEAIMGNPEKKKQILVGYITHFYEGVKETVKKTGSIIPHYVIVAQKPKFGGPLITEDVLQEAKTLNAEAIMSVEGFESKDDITDVIYHVTMSTRSMGVMGWVFKVRLEEEKANILAEKPYLFDSHNEVKSLGELIQELEETMEEH